MGSDQVEHEQLIDRILESPGFARATERRALLTYLFNNRHKCLSARTIEIEHYDGDVSSSKFNEGHARVSCRDLRRALGEYAHSSNERHWICELPKVDRKDDGYQLTFKQIQWQISATESFWQPHLEAFDETIVIGGWRLFFFDPDLNRVFRYYDFNVDNKDRQTLEDLQLAHPEAYKRNLRPQRDFYLAAGDVHAFERLQGWFHKRKGALLQRFISREVPEGKIHRCSPILLGRPVTNDFIQGFMDHLWPKQFGFRFHSTLGAIAIGNIRASEIERLSSYPLTEEGVLRPLPQWEKAFGIVTRFLNPSGHGHVTIIAADFHSLVTTQIVDLLTDEKLTGKLLSDTGWREKGGFPTEFEMIFAVPISPAGMEGEGHPELLLWRG